MYFALSCVVLGILISVSACLLGAQSDSELTTSSTQASSEGGERGYTSDSELYESASHHGNKVNAAASSNRTNINGEMEIKPLPDSHGSWVLVS